MIIPRLGYDVRSVTRRKGRDVGREAEASADEPSPAEVDPSTPSHDARHGSEAPQEDLRPADMVKQRRRA